MSQDRFGLTAPAPVPRKATPLHPSLTSRSRCRGVTSLERCHRWAVKVTRAPLNFFWAYKRLLYRELSHGPQSHVCESRHCNSEVRICEGAKQLYFSPKFPKNSERLKTEIETKTTLTRLRRNVLQYPALISFKVAWLALRRAHVSQPRTQIKVAEIRRAYLKAEHMQKAFHNLLSWCTHAPPSSAIPPDPMELEYLGIFRQRRNEISDFGWQGRQTCQIKKFLKRQRGGEGIRSSTIPLNRLKNFANVRLDDYDLAEWAKSLVLFKLLRASNPQSHVFREGTRKCMPV